MVSQPCGLILLRLTLPKRDGVYPCPLHNSATITLARKSLPKRRNIIMCGIAGYFSTSARQDLAEVTRA